MNISVYTITPDDINIYCYLDNISIGTLFRTFASFMTFTFFNMELFISHNFLNIGIHIKWWTLEIHLSLKTNTNIIDMHIMHSFWVFSYILNSLKKLCNDFFHVEGDVCCIVYHYPKYGDSPLIGRSNLLYACTNHFLPPGVACTTVRSAIGGRNCV